MYTNETLPMNMMPSSGWFCGGWSWMCPSSSSFEWSSGFAKSKVVWSKSFGDAPRNFSSLKMNRKRIYWLRNFSREMPLILEKHRGTAVAVGLHQASRVVFPTLTVPTNYIWCKFTFKSIGMVWPQVYIFLNGLSGIIIENIYYKCKCNLLPASKFRASRRRARGHWPSRRPLQPNCICQTSRCNRSDSNMKKKKHPFLTYLII